MSSPTASRVLTAYAWYKPSGLGLRLRRASEALAEAGIGVDYLAVSPPPFRHEAIRAHPVVVPTSGRTPDHTTPLIWTRYMSRAGALASSLANRGETASFFSFSCGAAWPLLSAARTSRKPLVVFLRSDELQENRIKRAFLPLRIAYRLLESRVVRRADRLVAVSESLASTIRLRYPALVEGTISVLYNDLPPPPPDLADCRKLALSVTGRDNAFIVSASARFNARKNAGLLLRALAKTTDNRTHLLLIGDGPAVPRLRQSATELGLDGRTTFTGWRTDAAALVAGSDLFVLPSFAEGMSNSLLEALAADVPCLVSDIPEHRELLPASATFQPSDAATLAARIRDLRGDEAARECLRISCRHAAERLRFDWDRRFVDYFS